MMWMMVMWMMVMNVAGGMVDDAGMMGDNG